MDIYKSPFLSKEDEKLLWQNAILVLDTSAICGLYDLTDYYRQIMVSIVYYLLFILLHKHSTSKCGIRPSIH